MPGRVLHLLSQRPSLTGSGVTLDATVRCAESAGWSQEVVVGVPAEDRAPEVGGLAPSAIHPLVFESGDLDFPVPGMSDVMPYPSTRFSRMDEAGVETYRDAWRRHLGEVLSRFRPDVIHSHHLWILSSIVKDVAPQIPVVTQVHATGLRQMELCSHLAPEIVRGCSRNDRFLVLHREMARAVERRLAVSPASVIVVGAGYREDLFHATGRVENPGPEILYAGKYSAAKGLPWLLDALEIVARRIEGARLHVAGSGSGPEAEGLRARMEALAPAVVLHGSLSQADSSRSSHEAVQGLRSALFFEGLPLVLVEALASGCRLVSTDLEGLRDGLSSGLGSSLELVPLPRLGRVDQPLEEDLPAFVDDLAGALITSLEKPPPAGSDVELPGALEPFTWSAVFRRIERVWKSPRSPSEPGGR